MFDFVVSKHRDWFDEQDAAASALLQTMYTTHLAYINDKHSSAKRTAYFRTKQQAQVKLREMKNRWWQATAELLQIAADRHDMEAFYGGLREVYGPGALGSAPVKSTDGTLLTERPRILERWVEHFQSVLNQKSTFETQMLSEIPQWTTATYLDDVPSATDVEHALRQTASGKSPGIDGSPSEVLKNGGPTLLDQLHKLFCVIWKQESVPQDFEDALVVHIYKRKVDRAVCDNHRGIRYFLLLAPLARVLLNRLNKDVNSNSVIPESQCGFRSRRGTMDIIIIININL